jgi:hypothetical protein
MNNAEYRITSTTIPQENWNTPKKMCPSTKLTPLTYSLKGTKTTSVTNYDIP